MILEWFRLGKSNNTCRKKATNFELSLRERDDCVVNKFSISLVSGLRAEAADAVTFYLCLREPFNLYVNKQTVQPCE